MGVSRLIVCNETRGQDRRGSATSVLPCGVAYSPFGSTLIHRLNLVIDILHSKHQGGNLLKQAPQTGNDIAFHTHVMVRVFHYLDQANQKHVGFRQKPAKVFRANASIVRAHAAPFPVRDSSNGFPCSHLRLDAEHPPCVALPFHTWRASLGRLHGTFRFSLPVQDCYGDWMMEVEAAVQRSENDGT